MTVKELIEILNTYDQTLPVVYGIFSEQCLLIAEDLKVKNLCEARPDGWVQDERKDMPTVQYLVFPGN